MAGGGYLREKKGNWSFQRRVPTALVGIIGRVMWEQTLKTQDKRIAAQRAKILEAETDAAITQGYRVLNAQPLTTDEVVTFGLTHFERTNAYLATMTSGISSTDESVLRRELERRIAHRARYDLELSESKRRQELGTPLPETPELSAYGGYFEETETVEPDPHFIRKSAEMRLATLIACLQKGNYSLVHTFADDAFERQGLARRIREPIDPIAKDLPPVEWLEIDRSRTDYQALARELMIREIEAVKRGLVQLSKAEVGWIDAPTQILAPAPATSPDRAAVPTELGQDANKTPSQLLARFANHSKDVRGASAMRSYATAIEHLEQVTGKKAIAMITLNDVVEWFELYSNCPQKYKTRLKAKTMIEAIAKNTDGAVPIVQAASIQKHLSHLRSFFNWAKKLNLIAHDPVGDLSIERPKRTAPANEDGKGYSIDELNKIFRLSPFLAPPLERGYRFWVPLVALFTGARMGEVCELDVSHIKTNGKIWWINMLNSKVKPLRRYDVPVHQELVKAGFIEFVKRKKAKGETKLFPDAPIGAVGRNAYSPVSQWFSNLLTGAELKRPGVNVHAFRHSFTSACRESGITREMAMILVDHKDDTVQGGYGDKVSVEKRHEDMGKLTFKGLDLTHLYP